MPKAPFAGTWYNEGFKGIIGLPANLFYGTGIPACIIVLDKEGATARKGIFMVDASKGFRKDGPKNRLREQDIHRIVDIFTRQVDVPGYARMVSVSEISDARNDYNLNLPRYIDSTEVEDLQDIEAHMQGGIPDRDLDALQAYWDIIPAVRTSLFEENRPGYSQLRIPASDIKPAIFNHPEFTAFQDQISGLFEKWKTTYTSYLKTQLENIQPKALIDKLAESLLASFRDAPLIDAYDVYQHLMDYWTETMQDDCYLIAADGWIQAAQPQLIIDEKKKKSKTRPDMVVGKKKYTTELIPPNLIVERYFKDEQTAIDLMQSELAALEQQLEEMAEEHGGEDSLLDEAKNEKDKLTKASVASRLKEIKTDKEAIDERHVLQACLDLIEQVASIGSRLKTAQNSLMTRVADQYGKLAEKEVKALVIDDKWMATLEAAVQGELDRISQTLAGRIRELAERYARPLPQLMEETETLSLRVEAHLKQMGIKWN